jgi:hypothetical protein
MTGKERPHYNGTDFHRLSFGKIPSPRDYRTANDDCATTGRKDTAKKQEGNFSLRKVIWYDKFV